MADQNKSSSQLHKLVIVGDGASGKTCLLIRRAVDKFPEDYVPTVFEQHVYKENINGQTIQLSAFDTGGGEDYHVLRPLCYPETDVFCLCFDVAWQTSFENIKSAWIEELSHHCPDVPVLLVGCKIDLRTNEEKIKEMKEKNLQFITEKQGHEMSAEIGAAKYVECSALTGQGVDHVFQNLAELARKYFIETKNKKKKCVLI
uniref:Rac and Cdc42-like 1 protein n=1 Tax=Phallusia mammillata TaxID=59560 RepID=A0A6F9DQX8_9ASCI|nr:Rac and Cdc42-like 1 protein [Phallusia mammillata]